LCQHLSVLHIVKYCFLQANKSLISQFTCLSLPFIDPFANFIEKAGFFGKNRLLLLNERTQPMTDFRINMSESPILRWVQSNRLVQHLLFWLLFLTFIVIMLFQRDPQNITEVMARDLFHFAVTILAVYSNRQWLFIRFFQRGRYTVYLLLLFLMMIAIALAAASLAHFVFREILVPHHEKFNPSFLIGFISFFMPQIFFISLTMLLHFAKEYVAVKELELKYHSAEQSRLQAQLQSLKAQINPHFLFNTLNNIYSHSLYNDPATPRLILQLSDLMSYIIYDCDGETALLSKELDFLQKYIALEKMRIDESVIIKVEIGTGLERLTIAPLLLLPLLENVFKHGEQVKSPEVYLHFRVHLDADGWLSFFIENKIRPTAKESMPSKSGIGLENVQKRLALIYPGRHTFQSRIENGRYRVELRLKPDEGENDA
jgi:sensor histidine kinase YesM